MIPNCDLSRENLSAGFSTRSDINQHVKQTLEISDLESREILINQIKRLCNELILIFYLAHFIFSQGLSIERVKKLHIDFTDNQKYL